MYIFTDCNNLNLCGHCFSYLKLNSYPVCDNSPYTDAHESFKAEMGLSDDEQIESVNESTTKETEQHEETNNNEQSTASEEHENTISQHKSSSNSDEETEEDSYNYDSSSYYNDIGKSDEQYINKITHRRHNSFGEKRLDIGYYSEESWLYSSDNDSIV